MNIITYPSTMSETSTLFLGGNTAKGDWQEVVIDALAGSNVTVVNTSRKDWDRVSPKEEDIKRHIRWELDWLYRSTTRFICIPANTKSPTVLLELGAALSDEDATTFVYVDPEYSHYNHVVTACQLKGVPVFTDFTRAVEKCKDLFLSLT